MTNEPYVSISFKQTVKNFLALQHAHCWESVYDRLSVPIYVEKGKLNHKDQDCGRTNGRGGGPGKFIQNEELTAYLTRQP